MKHQKPLAVRIFIRICVVFMTVSLIGVYVVYMFAPTQEAWEDNNVSENTWDVQTIDLGEVSVDAQAVDEIIPELDPENPENTDAPILVTEDGEVDEMDQMVEVQLENGETELVRQWDLWDAIQIAQ
jgi:hypothetical protein